MAFVPSSSSGAQSLVAMLLILAAFCRISVSAKMQWKLENHNSSSCNSLISKSAWTDSASCWDINGPGSLMVDCSIGQGSFYSNDPCAGSPQQQWDIYTTCQLSSTQQNTWYKYVCANVSTDSTSNKCPTDQTDWQSAWYDWWTSIPAGQRGFIVNRERTYGLPRRYNFICMSKGSSYNDTMLDPVVKSSHDMGTFEQRSSLPCKTFKDRFGKDVNASKAGNSTIGQCSALGADTTTCTYPKEDEYGQYFWGGVFFEISEVNHLQTKDADSTPFYSEDKLNRVWYNSSVKSVYGGSNTTCKVREDEWLYSSGVMVTATPVHDMTARVFAFASEDERQAALNDSRNEGLSYARKLAGANGCDVEIVYEFKPKSGGGLEICLTTAQEGLTSNSTENKKMIAHLRDSTSAYVNHSENTVTVMYSAENIRESQYLPIRNCDINQRTVIMKFSTQFICKVNGTRFNTTTIRLKRSDNNLYALSEDPENPTYFQLDPNNPDSCYYNASCKGENWGPDFFLTMSPTAAPVACGAYYWDPLIFSITGDGSVEVNTVSSDDFKSSAFDPTENGVVIMLIIMFTVLIVGLPVAWLRDTARISDNKLDGQTERIFWGSIQEAAWVRLFKPRTWGNWYVSVRWRMTRSHPWLSIGLHPQGDFLDTRKRLVILMTLLFNSAAVCSLLAGTEQSLPGLNGDFSLVVVAFIISYPVPYVIGSLFGRDMPGKYRLKMTGEKRKDTGSFFAYLVCITTICCKSEFEFDGGDEEEMGGDDDVGDDDGMDEGGEIQREDLQGNDHEEKEEDDEDEEGGQPITNNVPLVTANVIAGSLAFDAAEKRQVSSKVKKQPSERKTAWTTESLNNTMDDGLKSSDKLNGSSWWSARSPTTSAASIVPVAKVSLPNASKRDDGNGVRYESQAQTHQWVTEDYYGVVFAFLVSIGCAILDIACRIVMIILIETVQLFIGAIMGLITLNCCVLQQPSTQRKCRRNVSDVMSAFACNTMSIVAYSPRRHEQIAIELNNTATPDEHG
eukprot:jgi/Bigna1/81545/fgenesh1_pg.81_\